MLEKESRLINRESGAYEAYYDRKLNLADMELVSELQSRCLAADPGLKARFCPLSREELVPLLAGGGMMLGVFIPESDQRNEPDRPKLAAYRAIAFPHENEHLGVDIDPGKSEWDRVLHLEATLIDPVYRGNGLQLELTRLALDQCGDYRYIGSTVSPFNVHSLRNLLQLRLRVRSLRPKYGGALRYICFYDVQDAWAPEEEHAVAVPLRNLSRQLELLARGYQGFSLSEFGREWHLNFAKGRSV